MSAPVAPGAALELATLPTLELRVPINLRALPAAAAFLIALDITASLYLAVNQSGKLLWEQLARCAPDSPEHGC